MLGEDLEIEEIRTADSVAEANRLLQEGWALLGFHPAPGTPTGGSGSTYTIFVLGRLPEYDDFDEADDVELEEFDAISP